LIGRTAAPVLNVDSESVYFGIGDDIKRNVAHLVLPNVVAQVFMDVLNTMLPFPSMEKKKKKCKSEKGHLEIKLPMGRGNNICNQYS